MFKKNIILISFFIFIIIIASGVFLLYKNNNVADNIANDEKSEERASYDDNDIYVKATTEKNDLLCSGIQDDAIKDFCFKKLASLKKDEKLCQNIENEDVKIECYDNSNFEIAIDSNNLKNCLYINSLIKQKGCFEKVIGENLDITICDSIKDFEEVKQEEGEIVKKINFQYCLDYVNYNKGRFDKDLKYCDYISDGEFKTKCYSFVNNIPLTSDEDGDDLIYRDEIIYKTDPNNHDSDGDGFNDGEEIKNGYNPIGEGELNSGVVE